jgi:hypothetical protein
MASAPAKLLPMTKERKGSASVATANFAASAFSHAGCSLFDLRFLFSPIRFAAADLASLFERRAQDTMRCAEFVVAAVLIRNRTTGASPPILDAATRGYHSRI